MRLRPNPDATLVRSECGAATSPLLSAQKVRQVVLDLYTTMSYEPGVGTRKKVARTALGRRIENAARDVAAHLRGERPELLSYEAVVPETVDVAALRARLGLSQAAFARSFGLDLTAIQAWEQGRRRPDRAARILLAVIAHEPKAVLRTLTAEAAE